MCTENETNQLPKAAITCSPGTVEIYLPILTVSEANGGAKKLSWRMGKRVRRKEHWSEANKRHKMQKGAVMYALSPHRSKLHLPCLITITRYAPDKLDKSDNLPMSMKWVLDMICAVITQDFRPGRADDSDEIDVLYRQEKCEQYGVRIKIEMKDKNE